MKAEYYSSGGEEDAQGEAQMMDDLDQPFRGCRLNIDLSKPSVEGDRAIDSVFNDVTSLLYRMTLKHDCPDSDEDGKSSKVTVSSAGLDDARALVTMVRSQGLPSRPPQQLLKLTWLSAHQRHSVEYLL